jgi:hypothetical protein
MIKAVNSVEIGLITSQIPLMVYPKKKAEAQMRIWRLRGFEERLMPRRLTLLAL